MGGKSFRGSPFLWEVLFCLPIPLSYLSSSNFMVYLQIYYYTALSTWNTNWFPFCRLSGVSSTILYLWEWEEGGSLISGAGRAPWEKCTDFLGRGKQTCMIFIEKMHPKLKKQGAVQRSWRDDSLMRRDPWHHRRGIRFGFMGYHCSESLWLNSTLRRGQTV